MTNGDKIRSMSDMELSRELCKIAGVCSECLVQDMCDKGHTGFEQWLKEEVNEDESGIKINEVSWRYKTRKACE